MTDLSHYLEEEEEERQNVMVRGVTNGGLSHGNPLGMSRRLDIYY